MLVQYTPHVEINLKAFTARYMVYIALSNRFKISTSGDNHPEGYFKQNEAKPDPMGGQLQQEGQGQLVEDGQEKADDAANQQVAPPDIQAMVRDLLLLWLANSTCQTVMVICIYIYCSCTYSYFFGVVIC